VSETHGHLAVRRMPMMTPRDVVAASLAGLENEKLRVVVGFSNRLLGFVTQRFAPGWLARKVAGGLYRDRNVT
jgi:short-subunit dehydrogenase